MIGSSRAVAVRLLDALVERADRPAVRMSLALLGSLPWLGALIEFRRGNLHAARARLCRGWRPPFSWERRFATRIDQMLQPAAPLVPPTARACPEVRRVLFAVEVDTGRSGYVLRTQALATALRARGIDVWILPRLPASAPASPFEPEADMIERYAARLVRVVEENGIDLIHAASPYCNGLAASVAAARCGIAIVYEARGMWHMSRALREPMYAASEHYAYSESRELQACGGANRVVALSVPLARWLCERGVAEDRIHVVGNAASLPRAERSVTGDALRPPTLGYAGALVAYEGLDALLDALVSPDLADARLHIAGHGPGRRILQRRARALGIAERVVFLGKLDGNGLSAFYGDVDVVAVLRHDTPLTRMVPSLKPYDALAHGVPVVLSPAAAAALDADVLGRCDVHIGVSPRAIAGFLQQSRTAARDSGGSAPPPTWSQRAATLREAYTAALGGRQRTAASPVDGSSGGTNRAK